jgi:hypothetical protein
MKAGLLCLLVGAAALAQAGAQESSLTLDHRVLLFTTREYQKWATSFIENVLLGGSRLRRALTPRALAASGQLGVHP